MHKCNKPKNGWVVFCVALGKYMVAGDEDALARIVDKFWCECDKKFPDYHASTLVEVYELGNRISVGIKPTIANIEIMDKARK